MIVRIETLINRKKRKERIKELKERLIIIDENLLFFDEINKKKLISKKDFIYLTSIYENSKIKKIKKRDLSLSLINKGKKIGLKIRYNEAKELSDFMMIGHDKYKYESFISYLELQKRTKNKKNFINLDN